MEEQTIIQGVTKALERFSLKINEDIARGFQEMEKNLEAKFETNIDGLDKRFTALETEVRAGFEKFDHLKKKQDVQQYDLIDAKNTVNFLHTKVIQHEQILDSLTRK